MTKASVRAGAVLAMAMFAAALSGAVSRAALAQSSPDEAAAGQRIFKSANCVGCHKWDGKGGGGYGGAAANLRATALSLEQIEQTVQCGRPSTGMPHFDVDAYSDGRCYGLKQADLTSETKPPDPDRWLRPADIKAVASYVVADIKGKGDPTFEQCEAFFGNGTRACDVYPKTGGGGAQTAHAGSTAGAADQSSPPHLKIESAPDANASGGK